MNRSAKAATAIAGLALSAAVVGVSTGGGAASAAPASKDARHVVVVGTAGLTWSDISASATPNLWRLSGASGVGSLSVKAAAPVSCLDDGWLTLGAGNRADAYDLHGSSCGTSALALAPAGEGATIAGFADLYQRNVDRTDDTHLGALADALRSHGDCISAVGPPAALGAADSTGRVASYRADTENALADKAFFGRCAVTLVSAAPNDVDRIAQAVADNVPAGTALFVVGLAETGGSTAHLHAAIARGIGSSNDELVSASTRRAPFVQLVDVAPTIAQLRGVTTPKSMIGQPWRTTGGRAASTSAEVRKLSRLDLAAQRQSQAVVPYWVTLVALMLASCGLAAWCGRRRSHGWPGGWLSRSAALACAWCALLPVTGFMVGAVPWWSASHPLLALGLVAVAFASAGLVISVGLEFVGWRGRAYGLAAAVGTITFAVIVIDLATGAALQIFTLPGYSPLVAGRFAGIGNVGFGIFGAGALLAAAGWSALVVPQAGGWRRLPTPSPGVVCLIAGVIAVVADGAPAWGSDVGGVLALVPAFVVLTWLVTGVRISWRRALGVAGLAVAVIVIFALVDYARPSSDQTHLGRFVGDVVHGGAWTILRRKALADLHLLGYSVLTLLIPLMVGVAIWLLRMPPRSLRRAFHAAPVLRPVLVSLVVMAIVGAVLNDSGIVIPALAVLVVLPATMAAVAAAPERVTPDDSAAGEPDQPSSGLLR